MIHFNWLRRRLKRMQEHHGRLIHCRAQDANRRALMAALTMSAVEAVLG